MIGAFAGDNNDDNDGMMMMMMLMMLMVHFQGRKTGKCSLQVKAKLIIIIMLVFILISNVMKKIMNIMKMMIITATA